ncbi:MAG TPA: hypothetical protein PLD88_04050, partial [Candidatus Berkiella sp.]|nr:hypothetical protein [Candidatus Berkiella sp.]
LACIFSQKHILAANQHLYESSDSTIVPTLDFLEGFGILNRGRLKDIVDNALFFKKKVRWQKLLARTIEQLFVQQAINLPFSY